MNAEGDWGERKKGRGNEEMENRFDADMLQCRYGYKRPTSPPLSCSQLPQLTTDNYTKLANGPEEETSAALESEDSKQQETESSKY
ncbi:hypothetical protein Baya_6620 [Bagarius yarrelli]|uniref:Uncharacterized protein n=1 Tax=Bagarius yarrelli TaxID=175774 RepID=A0A556U1D1_BAGYA|nr:hypothetical protein Baya_6620 [Bagarius yarrelli]